MSGPAPLPLKDVLKGLPKPAKPKRKKGEPAPLPVDLAAEVGRILDEECHAGRTFRYPSGAKAVERFWDKDEKQVLRDAAVGAAAEALTMSAFLAVLKKVVKGVESGFAESAVRELIDEGRLHAHPQKTKAGGPLFALFAPPPPLSLPKARKELDKLAKAAAKLLKDTGAALDDLLAALGKRLTGPGDTGVGSEDVSVLILKAVENAGPGSVLSLIDLRREMPAEYRGSEFDSAVLRLADEERVTVYQDADPVALSAQERAECVADENGNVFKTIAKKG